MLYNFNIHFSPVKNFSFLYFLLFSFSILCCCFCCFGAGPGSQRSVLECYTELNVEGSGRGNCGTIARRFVPCEPEHVLCGQLMCDGGDFQSEEIDVSVTIYTLSVRVGSDFETCRTFSSSAVIDTVNPGLVPDGIKCGNESVSSSYNMINICAVVSK